MWGPWPLGPPSSDALVWRDWWSLGHRPWWCKPWWGCECSRLLYLHDGGCYHENFNGDDSNGGYDEIVIDPGTTEGDASNDFNNDDFNEGIDDDFGQDNVDPGHHIDPDDEVDPETDVESENDDCDLDNDVELDNNNDDQNENGGYNNEGGVSSKDHSLYHGAPISYRVMILLLAYAVWHKLTNKAITDLLYIIGLVCPQPNHCCSSLHKFKKYFSFMVLPSEFFYFCPSCLGLLDSLAITVCNSCK